MNLVVVLAVFLWGQFFTAQANVVLIGNNVTLSFDDTEANFAPAIKGSGECGVLYLAEPLDACSTLTNEVEQGPNYSAPFVLIVRGGCSFEEKVRRAQKAGFKAAIIYNNEDGSLLISKTKLYWTKELYNKEAGDQKSTKTKAEQKKTTNKPTDLKDYSLPVQKNRRQRNTLKRHGNRSLRRVAGNSAGIKIHAVFVSKASGEILKQYAGHTNMELWLIASFENSPWSIMAISFISLLAMSAVLATCFFVQRHRIRRERPQASHVREFHGMSNRLVKAMPSLIFASVLEDNCTSRTCAICLEDYSIGEKLRILPCRHKFHAFCVDSWLTSWRTFCPVCKRDARANTSDLPASESTPLLSSGPSSVASSVLSSMRSSVASSSAIQIVPALSQSPSFSLPHSQASTTYIQQSLRSSYRQSPYIGVNRSLLDLRNASSQRSHASSYFVSPNSFGYPSLSPLNSRYMSVAHIPSPSNASPSFISSSSHQQNPLHCSESAATFSPFASAQSLPEC